MADDAVSTPFGVVLEQFKAGKRLLIFLVVSVYLVVWVRKIVNLAHFVLKGLKVTVTPTREELVQFSASKGAKGKKGASSEKAFTIPSDSQITLVSKDVVESDLVQWARYDAWSLLVNVFIGSLFVIGCHELVSLFGVSPISQVLVMLWSSTAALFSLYLMFSTVVEYMLMSITHEILMSFGVWLVSLFISIGIVLNDSAFDFGLDDAYAEFSVRFTVLCSDWKILEPEVPSLAKLKLLLSFFSAFTCMSILFPTLRYVRCRIAVKKHHHDNTFMMVLQHLNQTLPLLALASFVPTIARRYPTALITESEFQFTRVLVLFGVSGLRIYMFRTQVQSYLYQARDKFIAMKNLKKKVRVSPVYLQATVEQVAQHTLACALQLLCPIVYLMSCTSILMVRGSVNEQAAFDDSVDLFGPKFFRSVLSFLCFAIILAHVVIDAGGWIYFSLLSD